MLNLKPHVFIFLEEYHILQYDLESEKKYGPSASDDTRSAYTRTKRFAARAQISPQDADSSTITSRSQARVFAVCVCF